jgi:hypothetical protein
MDDPARLLFFTSLTLKLCQRSNLSMPKIYSLFMDTQKRYGTFHGKERLLSIFPLLHSLSLKTAPLGDSITVHALETNHNNDLSPELDLFIQAFCRQLNYRGYSLVEDVHYGVVSILSLLPALGESHLVAKKTIHQLQGDKEAWHRSFEYCDEHGKSACLWP